MALRLEDYMQWPEIEALEYAECGSPETILGPRMIGRSHVLVTALFRDADSVKVKVTDTKKEYNMEKMDEIGYYAVLIPAKKIPDYHYVVKKEKKQENIEKKEPIKSGEVYSPIKGKVIALNAVKDATFAGEYLGKGVAIEPEEGRVVAPFDGKVTVVMDTKHAVGMTSDNGIEVLIHVGMDTVQLNGKHYTTHVKVDDIVKKGDLLLTFEKEAIQAEGYEITTPVVVTNTADFEQVEGLTEQQVQEGDKIIKIQ